MTFHSHDMRQHCVEEPSVRDLDDGQLQEVNTTQILDPELVRRAAAGGCEPIPKHPTLHPRPRAIEPTRDFYGPGSGV
jgi:hypothetical protein